MNGKKTPLALNNIEGETKLQNIGPLENLHAGSEEQSHLFYTSKVHSTKKLNTNSIIRTS